MRSSVALGMTLGILMTGACGGSVENPGSGAASGSGANGGQFGGGGVTSGGTGGTSSGGVPAGGYGGVPLGGGPAGGFGGGTGGIDCSTCGPPGAPCCSPGTGCGIAGPGGGMSCNCNAMGIWDCSGPGGGGTGGFGGGNGCMGPQDCQLGFSCCFGQCVNLANDIFNCGACGNVCSGPSPYCDGVKCSTPPCSAPVPPPPGTVCCGNQACFPGTLCCLVNQGDSMLGCYPPENGTCPKGCPSCICASPDTPIATPSGPRPIASLAEGDLVFSMDHGHVVAAPIVRTRRVRAHDHHVVRVELENGATLEISAPHPTADGRSFGDLGRGQSLDGIRISRVEVIPYRFDQTYDILPDTDSGTYFAGGVLIGSTLAPAVNLPLSVAPPSR